MSTDPRTRTERFWIDDTVVENSDDGLGLPFSTDTLGIVDEALGRIVLYCHMDDAEDILNRLRNS